MKRAMKSKEVKDLFDSFKLFELDKKARYEISDETIIIIDGEPSLFIKEGHMLPTLKSMQGKLLLKKIVVDMGAVPFVIKGADIMRPGIKQIEDGIRKDEFVVVVDEKHNKALSVGKALFDFEEMNTMASGKVIKNIHYVGDNIWNST